MKLPNRIKINTTIDAEQLELVKKNGWKYSDLIQRGIGAMVTPDKLREEIGDLMHSQKQLVRTITSLKARLYALEKDNDTQEAM
jgi:hypothetical protein